MSINLLPSADTSESRCESMVDLVDVEVSMNGFSESSPDFPMGAVLTDGYLHDVD